MTNIIIITTTTTTTSISCWQSI